MLHPIMALDLDIAGPVRVLEPEEMEVSQPQVTLQRLRASHHAAARLLARGMQAAEVSLQTGYSTVRISILQNDPSFRDLMDFYRRDANAASAEVEAQFLNIGLDVAQVIHDRVLDEPESITTPVLNDLFKAFTDRAGFAPVQRTVNKNVNLNIGDRLDAARRKREEGQ